MVFHFHSLISFSFLILFSVFHSDSFSFFILIHSFFYFIFFFFKFFHVMTLCLIQSFWNYSAWMLCRLHLNESPEYNPSQEAYTMYVYVCKWTVQPSTQLASAVTVHFRLHTDRIYPWQILSVTSNNSHIAVRFCFSFGNSVFSNMGHENEVWY